MRHLTRRIERIRCKRAVICVVMSFLMSVSCFPPRIKRQYIEPIGMYFEFLRKDGTLVISFGEKENSGNPNYFETFESRDCEGFPFYFVIDNISGIPKIKHVFYPNIIKFFDIHMPDCRYSIDYFVTQEFNSFRAYVEKLTEIPPESVGLPHYYVVMVWPAPYDRYLNYRVYDIGEVDDIDSYIRSFMCNPRILLFSDLQQADQKFDYMKNFINHGAPEEAKRFTVTESNRKDMMVAGWLFLDTMDISDGPVLEIDKWKVDDDILSIIYRVGHDGDRTPVNGARYPYAMERLKDRIYYQ